MNSEKNKKIRYIDYVANQLAKDKKEHEHAKKVDHRYNKDLFEKGTEWALNGLKLEDAQEYANNKSFLNGYSRGIRLLAISKMSQDSAEETQKPKGR